LKEILGKKISEVKKGPGGLREIIARFEKRKTANQDAFDFLKSHRG